MVPVETLPRAPTGGTKIPFIYEEILSLLLVVGGLIFSVYIGRGSVAPKKGERGRASESRRILPSSYAPFLLTR